MTTRPANNRVQAVTSQQAISNENARLKQQVDELRQQLAQMMHSRRQLVHLLGQRLHQM